MASTMDQTSQDGITILLFFSPLISFLAKSHERRSYRQMQPWCRHSADLRGSSDKGYSLRSSSVGNAFGIKVTRDSLE